MEGLDKNLILEAKKNGEQRATRIMEIIAKEYETENDKPLMFGEILVLTACVSAGLLSPLIKDLMNKGEKQKILDTMKAYFELMKFYMKEFVR
jgi:hypothetical protein